MGSQAHYYYRAALVSPKVLTVLDKFTALNKQSENAWKEEDVLQPDFFTLTIPLSVLSFL